MRDEDLLTLKMLRQRSGLTQVQLAELLGVRQATVSDWERGKAEPNLSPAQTLKLCQLLNCTLDELVEAIENIKRMHRVESDRQ